MKKLLLTLAIAIPSIVLMCYGFYTGGLRFKQNYLRDIHKHAPRNINLETDDITVINWPKNFDSVMHETGEINSPMHFEKRGDTLIVGFSRD